METILQFLAIPFNTPTYRMKKGANDENSDRIIAMGDIVAKELQDPNSAASQYLNSLRKHQSAHHLPTQCTCDVRYKPGILPKNSLEHHVLKS